MEMKEKETKDTLMGDILIFAGTTEGRRLSALLAASGIPHTVCVATEYGESVLEKNPLVQVHQGRMDCGEMCSFFRAGGFRLLIDATHPYAREVTGNIRKAAQEADIPCLRLMREEEKEKPAGNVRYFDSHAACADALLSFSGNILLTTGSKELESYCISEALKRRLFVRVLPSVESILACGRQGITGRQILAMQGPFSAEMNEALIRQYEIACLVTKDSGRAGGFAEKLKAAEHTGIAAFVIGRPKEAEGLSFSEICRKLEGFFDRRLTPAGCMEIVLAGAGMGHPDGITGEVRKAIEESDLIMGAPRLLAAIDGGPGGSAVDQTGFFSSPGRFSSGPEKKPFYRAEQIIPFLEELQAEESPLGEGRITILFSGDSGFYSGCGALYRALKRETDAGRLRASLRILPGISSVSFLASWVGESYEDAAILSMHGRRLTNLTERIHGEAKTFLLTSGLADIRALGHNLLKAGLSGCEVIAGFQLGSPEQEVRSLTPEECCGLEKEGLYTCLIRNPSPRPRLLAPGLPDDSFIRDRVPMTKEEIRQVSICKLRLFKGAVLYDIGSGTGSVSVEAARLSGDIQVYAVEQKEEAADLTEQNRAKFQLDNLTVINGRAPEALSELPAATHAFIGGSSGGLLEILDVLYRINPRMRVVINAVSLETVSLLQEALRRYPAEHDELIQLQTSRAEQVGNYHLMKAGNPVWICAFDWRTGNHATGNDNL